jgi:enoyl-CoA hydratase
MDLLITGRVIDAVEAATQTYAAWKLSVNRSVLMELDAYTDYERRLANLVRATEDAKEGRDAFREKRPPRFSGR